MDSFDLRRVPHRHRGRWARKRNMKRNCRIATVAVMLLCGCQQSKIACVPRMGTEEEKAFVENPCCQTTHGLVMKQHGAAVPLILATLDRHSGETNAPTRCLIIQGALWKADDCTNLQFQAVIQRGNADPSESVRLKTTSMVTRAFDRLRNSAAKKE